MIEDIRALVSRHGGIAGGIASLADDGDLYAAGLSSFASVQLMLAIEDHFNVEFPDRMLNRRSFSSLAAIAACVNELTADRKVA
jgi:acyl carrier protein